jgi:O-succinylbenzoic acid--CoA ligase
VKPLERVSAADLPAVTTALRAALDGGPAVWPVATSETTHPAERASDRDGTAGAGAGARPPGGRGEAGASALVEDGVALVVETSGSTDAPKRVLLSADALRASAEATAERLGGHGRWLLALPAHYVAGAQVLVRSIVAGTEPVVLVGERFDPDAFVEATSRLMRTRDAMPRYTSLVPVQLARLVEASNDDPAHPAAQALRAYTAILIGGQALPESSRRSAEALGARIVRTYGSSETAGGCVYDGRPLSGVRLRVAADGIVELGGPTLADGYLGDTERTSAAFRRDDDGTRWYRTGDLGELTGEGVLRIRGRVDDVIISGGVKVALGEIERAVRALPGLADAVVVPIADPEWGQRAAVVVAGASASSTLLGQTTDAAGLPPAARPVLVVEIDELPLLASGKPDRRRLAELAEMRRTGSVG